MKSLVVLFIGFALVIGCGVGATGAPTTNKSAPAGPVTKYRNTLPGLNAGGPIDLIQSVIDFAPGAQSAVHIHTSPNLATVLQGQISVKTPAADEQLKVGEMVVEPINQRLQAVNSGSGEAMVVVAFVVAHGSKPTTPVAGQPAPAIPNKTLYTFTLASPSVSGGYGIVQQVLDFAPVSQTPRHSHGGPGVITVLQGQLTLNRDGVEKTYSAGDSFTEMPGQSLQAFNRGTSEVLVAATFLLPDGAQLTTNI